MGECHALVDRILDVLPLVLPVVFAPLGRHAIFIFRLLFSHDLYRFPLQLRTPLDLSDASLEVTLHR